MIKYIFFLDFVSLVVTSKHFDNTYFFIIDITLLYLYYYFTIITCIYFWKTQCGDQFILFNVDMCPELMHIQVFIRNFLTMSLLVAFMFAFVTTADP